MNGTLNVWRSAPKEEANDKEGGLGFREKGELQRKIRQALFWAHYHEMRAAWDKSIDHWTTALEIDPNDKFSMQRRALAYDRAGNLSESGDDGSRLVQLTDALNGEYLVKRGESYAKTGRREAARADLAKALSLAGSQQSIERILSSLAFAKPVVETGAEWRYTLLSAGPD